MAKKKAKKKLTAKQKARRRRKVVKKLKKATGLAARAVRKPSIGAGIRGFGNVIAARVKAKVDAPRMELSKEISKARRSARIQANAYRRAASKEKDSKIAEMLNANAEELEKRAQMTQRPKLVKNGGVNDYAASNNAEYLTPYAQEAINLIDFADPKGLARRQDAFFTYNFNLAADKEKNFLFPDDGKRKAKGLFSRAQTQRFLSFYYDDWKGLAPSERFAAIKAAHGGASLMDLYEAAFEGTRDVNGIYMTWWEFVADWVGIDYDNVDTSNAAWQSMIDSEYAALDVSEQWAISKAWGSYK